MKETKEKSRVFQIILSGCVLIALILYGAMPMLSLHQETSEVIAQVTPEATTAPTPAITPEPTLAVTPEPIEVSEFGQKLQAILLEIEKQEAVDQSILDELANGGYTFDEPLVIVDPYNCSPLTALVIFRTEEPVRISVELKGKTKQADVSFSFDEWNMEHLIPIYGLYAEIENQVNLTATKETGEAAKSPLLIQTEALSLEFNGIILQPYAPKPQQYQEGFNFGYITKFAYDFHGEIRWANTMWGDSAPTLYQMQEGTYMTADGAYYEGDVLFFERNLLGKFIRVLYGPYGNHHDIEKTDNATLLISGTKGSMVEDYIYELDINSGEIINALDLKRVLPVSSLVSFSEGAYTDWFHLNAVAWQQGSIIVSGRHMSTVAKLGWPSGEVQWILASHDGWLPLYQQYLLTPVGEGFEWPSFQHAPEILPDYDRNPDTLDILLFDNGNHRNRNDAELQRKIQANEMVEPTRYSRMVHYRINEKEKTIEQVWQYGKERGEELYAQWQGDADLQANGNRLGLFPLRKSIGDKTMDYSIATEVTPDGELVWEMLVTGEDGAFNEYRIERQPFYGQASLDLKIGIPTLNLIPSGVLKQNGVQ